MQAMRPVDAVRLDKWLWAARFFKTRQLAHDAIDGEKVHVNGARAKPARVVRLGDTLEVQGVEHRWVVVVRALSDRRGPAIEARALYEETPESVAAREQRAQARRLGVEPGLQLRRGRPTKRERRELDRYRGG